MTRFLTLVFSLFVLVGVAQENPALRNKKETVVSRLGEYKGYSEATYGGYRYRSFYHTTADGVKLAVDLFLPKKRKPDEKIPAVLYLTRYVRSLEGKGFIKWLKHPILGQISEDEIKFFVSHGYACLIVDARGSGASSSSRDMDFSPREIADMNGIMDWVTAQPWSNGKIGTTGVSYVGTTAELMVANRHPAHAAAIPRSAIFDLYEDVCFPGGLRQGPFVEVWGRTTAALDRNDLGAVSPKAKKFVRGVNPVQNDKKRIQLSVAIQDHADNYQVHRDILTIECRDDLHKRLQEPIDQYSVHSRLPQIAGAHTAIYRIGGYYDGGLGASVIKGLLNTPNTERVLIGPWDHGPRDYVSPFAAYPEKKFDVRAEMLRFFDYHLKGIDNGIGREPKIQYFTVGKEAWDTASAWPPVGTVPVIYNLADSMMMPQKDRQPVTSRRSLTIDYGFTTGAGARWNSLTPLFRGEPHTNYNNWAAKTAGCLSYDSPLLEKEITLTGEVVFTLYLASDAEDGAVLVFLEEVEADGSVHYITEGQLRLMHRNVEAQLLYKRNGPSHSYRREDIKPMPVDRPAELQITSLPISYAVSAGSRLRISIAGADKGHSDEVKAKPARYVVYAGEAYPSSVVLPVSNR